MIPQSTTLQERLEFYEWALDRIEKGDDMFICHCAERFFNVWDATKNIFKISDLFSLFPEVCEDKKIECEGQVLFMYNKPRIEALQKAIIEVKRKIEEE